jgi:hypothetical protein
MDGQPRYWFPAKRYGWGWGPPITWEGWFVLAVFIALVAVGPLIVSPALHPAWFSVYVAVLCVGLTLVCRAKGEPTRWRSGDRS